MMSSIGAAELLIILGLLLFVLIPLAWWLWGLVQALKTPDAAWQAAGQSKILYVLLMVFLGILGTLLYVLIPRPAIRRAEAAEYR